MGTVETNGKSVKGLIKAPPVGLVDESRPVAIRIERKDYAPRVLGIQFVVEGLSPLIVNNFGSKSREQMAAKQQQTADSKRKRAPKEPTKLFESAKYLDAKGRDCVPVGAFRNAMISAARAFDDASMTELKQAIFVEGPDGPAQTLLPIKYSRCVMREDAVRNKGTADLRYRPEYQDWSCAFTIQVRQA